MINPNEAILGYDTTFELDDFGKPRLRKEAETIKNCVLYVLFTKPGNHPSLPYIGLDIESMLFTFYDEINEQELRDQIIAQCSVLGVYFDQGMIQIRKIIFRNKPSLMIHIETTQEDALIRGQVDLSEEENGSRFQIGITFNELDQMIHSISEGRAS